MSLSKEIEDFFNKYGEEFNLLTITYAKQLVHKIKSSDILHNFLSDNNITASMLLNEIVPYSNYKFNSSGDEKLDMGEIQSILNIILFSNELEKLIMEDHVIISSIGSSGELFYIPDEYTVKYFMEKYGIELKENQEFDYTILEDNDIGSSNFNFGIN